MKEVVNMKAGPESIELKETILTNLNGMNDELLELEMNARVEPSKEIRDPNPISPAPAIRNVMQRTS